MVRPGPFDRVFLYLAKFTEMNRYIKLLPFPLREFIRIRLYGSSPNRDLTLFIRSQKKQPVLIDVGAETGYDAILASKNGYKVYAFEPDEYEYHRLTNNIALEKARNIEVIKKAVYHTDGTVTFYSNPAFGGTNSISTEFASQQKTTVPATRLDTFCQELEIRPDYLKIDAEGVSLEVLKSYAFQWHQPIAVLVEPDDEQSEQEMLSILQKAGFYTFFAVFRQKEMGERSILKRYDRTYDRTVEFADIVAIRTDLGDSFKRWVKADF